MKHNLKLSWLTAGAMLILLFSNSCKSGQSKAVSSTDINKNILEAAKQAFFIIPDHDCISKDAEQFMTANLYNTLLTAWNVPEWADREPGDKENLLYFVTGQDGDVGTVTSVTAHDVHDGKCVVELEYSLMFGNEEYSNLMTIGLSMLEEDGKWLLDDFDWHKSSEEFTGESWGGVKAYCKEYTTRQVNDFLSGKTVQRMKDLQTEDSYTDEHISKIEKEFQEFIAQNRNYLEPGNNAYSRHFHISGSGITASGTPYCLDQDF